MPHPNTNPVLAAVAPHKHTEIGRTQVIPDPVLVSTTLTSALLTQGIPDPVWGRSDGEYIYFSKKIQNFRLLVSYVTVGIYVGLILISAVLNNSVFQTYLRKTHGASTYASYLVNIVNAFLIIILDSV